MRKAYLTDLSALGRYERRLRPNVEKVQKAGRSFARWFVPDGRARLMVRDAATRMSSKRFVSLLLGRRFAWTDRLKL